MPKPQLPQLLPRHRRRCNPTPPPFLILIMLLIVRTAAAIHVHAAPRDPAAADNAGADAMSDLSGAGAFDIVQFCAQTSAGSAEQFCGTREFHEREEVTEGTVRMVAMSDATAAADKACRKAFAVDDLLGRTDRQRALTSSKAVVQSDVAARGICERMSR